MNRKILIAVSLVGALFTSSCNRTKVGGGHPPKFADCDQGAEVDWAGQDVCAQESDPTHYTSTNAVKIVSSKCKGIHVSHTKDFRIDVLLRQENTTNTCPLQPFEKTFPANSTNGHVHTGLVKDRSAYGCEYEVHFKELSSGGSCDPHIDIGP